MIDQNQLFFSLYALRPAGEKKFLGSAAAITPDGGLLTCRHVVELGDGWETVVVKENKSDRLFPVSEVNVSSRGVDLAFLPRALPGECRPFLPILTPAKLLVGTAVYTFGFFAVSGPSDNVERGYFAGSIVNFSRADDPPRSHAITLPYPVVEGLSGTAVLTYHNGPKLVGVAYGNRSSRVIASEVSEVSEDGRQFTETIHRIVEFGLAFHPAAVHRFLLETGVTGYVVSDTAVPEARLEVAAN